MGHMLHHAIIVESWDLQALAKARSKALSIFSAATEDAPYIAPVSPMAPFARNGGGAFVVFPDGSKEGWEHSLKADMARAEFVAWLRTKVHGDGSSTLKWVELAIGDDDLSETSILRQTGDHP